MIYFIQGVDGTPIKIGYTQGPTFLRSRISTLQTGYPWTLRALLTIEHGDMVLEREIHAVFEVERLRGEWFEASPNLILFIEHCAIHGVEQVLHNFTTLAKKIAPFIGQMWIAESQVKNFFRIRSGLIQDARIAGTGPSFAIKPGKSAARYYNVAEMKQWLSDRNIAYACHWGSAAYMLSTADKLGLLRDAA